MKTFSFTDAPVQICGLNHIDPANRQFWRLSDADGAAVSEGVRARSKTTAGARVRFRTDTRTLKLKMTLHTLGVDPCIPICGSGGADVMRGTAENTVYMGLINPWSYDNKSPEAEFRLDGSVQQITVNLPRNEQVAGLEISIDDDAQLLPPAAFTRPGKLCFYGSSITEGGCCTRTGNAYTAAVARWLDMDSINYGFSGLAKGKDAMADLIARDDYAALVYDYDHNAPDAAHLERTHERFFRRIREARPELPILIMTKPDFDADPVGNAARRDVIYRTYLNARAAGDQKVWFLDGEQLFGTFGREMCSVDNCHPNDLGFFRMAEKVYAMLLKML